MSRKKKIITALIVIVAVVVGWKFTHPSDKGYIMGTVQKRTISEIVSESGTITTNGQANVYSPTNGVVDTVYVENDEIVEEGQKLFSVKSTASTQEKAAAYATYESAKSALDQAENNRRSALATVKNIYDQLQGHTTDETFAQKDTRTTAEVANDNAYEALVAAQASLKSALVAYEATQNSTVIAPIAGRVLNLSVVPGSNVTIYNSLVPSSPILIIGDLGKSEIQAAVGEGDINKIKIGQAVEIKLDAVDGKTYHGTVKRYDENGTITQNVVKFNVYVEIADSDSLIKPGMSADIDIHTNELSDVLSVPNNAVKPYQKGRAVREAGRNGSIQYLPVTTGIRGKEYTQITGGLKEGQEIIVSLSNEQTKQPSLFGL